jgi:uncharacterized protein (TIGR02246 family)
MKLQFVLYQQLMDGWNKGSGEAFAAPFAEDGDLVGMDGTHLKGRQEIISFNQQLFDTYVKGSRLVGKVRSVRATKVNGIKLSVPSRKMSFW